MGRKLREVEVPGLLLTEAIYSPGSILPWHSHERANFCVLVDGSYTENIGRAKYRLDRFDVTFKPEGETHRDEYGEPGARCLILEIMPGWLEDLPSRAPLVQAPLHLPNRQLLDLSIRLYREFHCQDQVAPLALQAVCVELLVHVTRAKRADAVPGGPAWLNRVREILHDAFAEPLDLEQLAALAGVHRVHLAQAFRKAYGCTIGDYVRRLRVHHAAHELATTEASLVEVALGCGFYDQSHFTRTFKQYTGLTPGHYRTKKAGRLDVPKAGQTMTPNPIARRMR